MRNLHALLFLALSASTYCGQVETASTPLRILEVVPITSLQLNINAFRVVMGQSEFYIDAGAGKYMAVNLEGHSHSALDLSMVPATDSMKPSELFVVDLSPDPRGGVNALVVWTKRREATSTSAVKEAQMYGIVRFDDHGDYEELFPLETPPGFNPTHLAEFSSGKEFLIDGFDDRGKVHLSIFGNRGEMFDQKSSHSGVFSR